MTDVFGMYAASLALPAVPRIGLFLIVIATAFTRHDAPGVRDFTSLSSLPRVSKWPKPPSSLVAQQSEGVTCSSVADRRTAAGWDQAAWDRLAGRLTILTSAFLTAVVPRAGRPVRTGTDEPGTQSFMAALEHAVGLLVGAALGDSPAELTAAVDEAELRWSLVQESRTHLLDESDQPQIGCHPDDDRR